LSCSTVSSRWSAIAAKAITLDVRQVFFTWVLEFGRGGHPAFRGRVVKLVISDLWH
jgi:hypothetical protein